MFIYQSCIIYMVSTCNLGGIRMAYMNQTKWDATATMEPSETVKNCRNAACGTGGFGRPRSDVTGFGSGLSVYHHVFPLKSATCHNLSIFFLYPKMSDICQIYVRYVTPTWWASGSSAMLSGSSCGTSAQGWATFPRLANINWFPTNF